MSTINLHPFPRQVVLDLAVNAAFEPKPVAHIVTPFTAVSSTTDDILPVSTGETQEDQDQYERFSAIAYPAGGTSMESKRRLAGVPRSVYYELSNYLVGVSAYLSGVFTHISNSLIESRYFTPNTDPSDLLARDYRRLRAEITDGKMKEAVADFMSTVGSGRTHIVQASKKMPGGVDIVFCGIPGISQGGGSLLSYKPLSTQEPVIPKDTTNFKYKDLQREDGQLSSAFGKALVQVARAIQIKIFGDAEVGSVGRSYKRSTVHLPLDYDFYEAVMSVVNSSAELKATGIDLGLADYRPPAMHPGIRTHLGNNVSIFLASEPINAVVSRKISAPDKSDDTLGIAPEFLALQPDLGLSFVLHVPEVAAHFISQTPRGKQPLLQSLNTWASIWARALMRAPGQKGKKGVAESRRMPVKSIPRYVLSATATEMVAEKRKSLGYYTEKGRSNDDDLFVSDKGRFHYCPKSTDLSLENAKNYEALMEEALRLSFETGTPLNSNQVGETHKVFSLANPTYKDKIRGIKDDLKKYAGSMQTFSWDYNCILTASASDPDRLTSINLAGTVKPSDLSFADYLRRPFYEGFALLFNESAVNGKPLNKDSFQASNGALAFTSTSISMNVLALYKYLIAEKVVPSFPELVVKSAKDLGYKSLVAQPSDDDTTRLLLSYETDLYRQFIKSDLTVVEGYDKSDTEADLSRQVRAIESCLRSAIKDSTGSYNTNLYRVIGQTGGSVVEDPHYFNAEAFTTAEFKNIYSYLGGRIFYNVLRAIVGVDKKKLMVINRANTCVLPPYSTIVKEIMPFSIMFGKYLPNIEELYKRADEEAERNSKSDDIGPADIKIPGSKEGLQIFPHQMSCHRSLRNHPKFAILDVAPGGGKTILVITDIAELVHSGKVKRPVVFAPQGLVKGWIEELHKVTEGRWNAIPLTTSIMNSWGEERLAKLITNAPPNTIVVCGLSLLQPKANRKQQIVIGNHVETVSDSLEFLKRFAFDYVAIDEAHKVKSTSSVIHKMMKQICTASSTNFIRLVTGTLIKNDLLDVVGQCAMFSSQIFLTAKEYEDAHKVSLGDSSKVMVWSDDAPEQARRQIAKHASIMTFKRKEWAFMLPIPIEEFIPVRLDNDDEGPDGRAHQAMYDSIFKTTMEEIMEDPELADVLNDRKSLDDDEDDDDEDDDDKRGSGSTKTDDDQDDSDIQELQAKLHPYLQRLEMALTDPMGDPNAALFFGEKKSYVSAKVKKIVERIRLNFVEHPWEKGEAYKIDDVVDHAGTRYILLPPKTDNLTAEMLDEKYISHTDPSKDSRWKEESMGKVLVFCRYTRSVEAIYRALPPDLRKIAAVFHGSTSVDEQGKAQKIDRWGSLEKFKTTPFSKDRGVQILIANEEGITEGHNLQCFPYQTQVMIDYNKSVSIGEIYDNPAITHVLSYDLKTKKIEKKRILNRIRNPVKSKDVYLNVRVQDNRSKKASPLLLTDNHVVFLKDGSEVQAKDLKVGDQLITYGTSFDVLRSSPDTGDLFNKDEWAGYRTSNKACPECGEVMHSVAHAKHLYEVHGVGKKQYAERKARRSAATARRFEDPEFLEAHKARARAIGNDPEERKRRSEIGVVSWTDNDPRRIAASKRSKKRWADPVFKQKTSLSLSKALKKFYSTEEGRASIEAKMERYYEDKEAQARMSELRSEINARPSVKRKLSSASKRRWSDPEVRSRMCSSMKEALSTPEARQRKSDATAWCHANIEGYTEAGIGAMLKAQGTLPNKPEKAVIALQVEGLNYTGDGDYWVSLEMFGRKVNKNPDFISLNHLNEKGRTYKVVEVIGARDFTGRDASYDKALIKAYKKVGIECLIIEASDCIKHSEKVHAKLQSFINNHYLTVTSISLGKSKRLIGEWKYDLTVQKNHNFFACAGSSDPHNDLIPVLVHNCASRLIRVEIPWAPGTLDQSSSRIFRPDPSGKYKREVIYLDWIMCNNTMEAAKLGRLISKMISKTKFDEQGNHLYDNLDTLPPIRMSLKVIKSLNNLSDLTEYMDAYATLAHIQGTEFREMRRTRSSTMIPLDVTPMMPGAAIIEQVPYVPDLHIPDRHGFGLVRLNEYLDEITEPDVISILEDKQRLVGRYAHTEAGNGVIVRVGLSNRIEGVPEQARKITRVTVQLANGDQYNGPASMIYLAPHLNEDMARQFTPKTPWATPKDKRKQERLDRAAERAAVREEARQRKRLQREARELSKIKELGRKTLTTLMKFKFGRTTMEGKLVQKAGSIGVYKVSTTHYAITNGDLQHTLVKDAMLQGAAKWVMDGDKKNPYRTGAAGVEAAVKALKAELAAERRRIKAAETAATAKPVAAKKRTGGVLFKTVGKVKVYKFDARYYEVTDGKTTLTMEKNTALEAPSNWFVNNLKSGEALFENQTIKEAGASAIGWFSKPAVQPKVAVKKPSIEIKPPVRTAKPTAATANSIALNPVVYNGFLALEAVSDELDSAAITKLMKPFAFKEFGEYASVKILDYKSFEAVLDYLDSKFIISPLTRKRLDMLQSSFQTGRGRKFDIELAPTTDFKNFWNLRHKMAVVDSKARKSELKVYPVIEDGILKLAVDIATNPVIRKHLDKLIPGTRALKFVKKEPMHIQFYDSRADLVRSVKAVLAAGVKITNYAELKDEVTELARTLKSKKTAAK